ncbi:hypothetical protein CAXC1_220054 [Candidatus Xenohaliotis californiensis]|uniref:Uncharacterized protein n=1 Tax=Candidatus Xenohaliotis californiensis TaxID=84677 RepID=A0ABM9N7U7_9RICK|nr:hypothetical protein CAXC1_220054 [Candidatus Xenohaliotis californiensis]
MIELKLTIMYVVMLVYQVNAELCNYLNYLYHFYIKWYIIILQMERWLSG